MSGSAAGLLYETGLALLQNLHPETGARPRITIINAVPHPALNRLVQYVGHSCFQQHRRDIFLALSRAGYAAEPGLGGGVSDLALVLADRQRMQTMGWIAAAMAGLAPHGRLVFCAPNNLGARAYEKRLQSLAKNVRGISKSKCRCMVIRKTSIMDVALLSAWKKAAAFQRVEALGLISCPGVFSWDRIDAGSRLLVDHLPDELHGRGMDLGCGNGFLAVSILRRCKGVHEIHVVDADAVALECARRNLARSSHAAVCAHWLDAAFESTPGGMDWVVLNPPFHSGRERNITLGQSMIHASIAALRPSGRLYLVANRTLPYESVLKTLLHQYRNLYQGDGFKVITGVKPGNLSWQRPHGASS